MDKMSDYVYPNPPLVEVIAEIHWEIQTISSIPNAAIDPFYSKCLEKLRAHQNLAGYRYEEKLVPDGIPIELLGDKPLIRFRPTATSWPLFQLGPGLFIVNLVPPYKGWKDFRGTLEVGLSALLESYPQADENLSIKRLELKYIDAFGKKHGYSNYAKFLASSLQLPVQLPTALVDRSVAGGVEAVITASQIEFPLSKMPNSTGKLKIVPGKSNDEDAVIAAFEVLYTGPSLKPEPDHLLKWFDQAHFEARSWFELVITDAIKATFGSPIEV